MKKLILILSIIAFSASANCQKVQTDSKGNYIAVKTERDSSPAKPTGKTYTDTKGNVFPVYISAKGKLFVNRISKTGNSYKQYLKL